MYVVAVEAANRSGQATSRLITFVGIVATIFGVIIALAGGFIGYEGMRARRKSMEAIKTLEEAKSFVETEVERLRKKIAEIEKLMQLNLDQLKQDTEEAGRKVAETSARKIEELEAKDISLEREGKIALLEKRIKFFEEIGMPDDPKVLYSKAMMCREKGMKGESVELLKKVISAEPENKNAHFFIGFLEAEQGSYEKALEAYKCNRAR